MKRFGIFVLLVAAMFANSKYADADPLLSLGSRDALPGQSVFMDLQLSGGAESYAGLNARIELPAGVTLISVSKGSLLSANFTTDWRSYPGGSSNEATVVAYSGLDAVSTSAGLLLQLELRVDAGTAPDTYPVDFAANPTSPTILIRSGHALSNADGTTMVAHVTGSGLLTVLPASADSDHDNLPDSLEQQIVDADPADAIHTIADVDPKEDFDGDGESNESEYKYGTDPTDALSTIDPANAYTAFIFEIYRGADQTTAGSFAPSLRGAKLICWPQDGDTFTDGSLTKPAGTAGEAAVTLDISAAGDEARYEKDDYLSLSDLTSDFVAGTYNARLGIETPGAGVRQLRFNIDVPAYTEANFPGYVRVETPPPDAVDVLLTPLLDFDTDQWNYVEIIELDSGDTAYFHIHDVDDDPADTHQVDAADALWPLTDYLLEVDINDRGNTWLGSRTAILFTTMAESCECDFDTDGDIDGADLSDFLQDRQGFTPADFAADFGRNNCP